MIMNFSKILFFSLFFFFLFTNKADSCSITSCKNSSFPIHFPFQLQAQKQPKSCGFPGFNLSCNLQGITVINLPYFGELSVRNIDYIEQRIQLYDPDDCLPRHLLLHLPPIGFNSSPFVPVFTQNFTFLSCPSEAVMSNFTVISCLSDSNESVMATASMSFAKSMAEASCKIISTLPLPFPVQFQELSFDFHGDFLLKWSQPDCEACELHGGVCGFKNNRSQEITCFYNYTDGSSRVIQIVRYITLFLSLSIIACTFGIGFSTCFTHRRIEPQDVDAQQTQSAIGLDELTIQSYEKLVLGESRRLPGPNDTTCPICLSEYCNKDTLRCIPQCRHCFHADCVDAWLRMNTTCPVCRNTPSRADLSSNSNI